MNKIFFGAALCVALTGCKTIEQAINQATRQSGGSTPVANQKVEPSAPAKSNEAILRDECLKFVKAQTAVACDVKVSAPLSENIAGAIASLRLPVKVASPSISDARMVQKRLLDKGVNSSITTTDKVASGVARIVVGN